MIDKENFHILNYIKKEEYSGGMDGMRYMLKKEADREGGDHIAVTIWPEPFGFHKTPEEEKTIKYVALTPEGVEEAADWLNQMYLENKARWDAALDWHLS